MVSSLLRHYLINTTWFVIQHRFLLLFHALTFSDKDTVWFSFTSNFNEKKSGVDFTWSRSLPIMFTMCHKLIRVYQIIIHTVSKKLKRDEIVKCWWWSWLWQAVTRFNASANWIWLKLQSLRVSRKFRRTELFSVWETASRAQPRRRDTHFLSNYLVTLRHYLINITIIVIVT